MNKKGFTLIELLAVLLILAIILTITIYSVSSILDNAEENLSKTQEERLFKSAEMYYLEEGINLEYSSGYTNQVCVDVEYLINNQYIDKDKVTDPKTNEELTGSVLIKNISGKYKYVYQDDECTNAYN